MHEDVRWFIGLILIFAIFWLVSGGPFKASSKKPYIVPLNQAGGGTTYGNDFLRTRQGAAGTTAPEKIQAEVKAAETKAAEINQKITVATEEANASPLKGKLSISTVSRGYGDKPTQEYVRIQASSQNSAPVPLSGLRLESGMTGSGVTIGNGAYLPFQGSVNSEQPASLNPGDYAYIITGRSPLGISFQLNKCTGYFGQYQQFTPYLYQNCPRPWSDVPSATAATMNDSCIDYIQSLSYCSVYPNPPASLDPLCARYVTDQINYPKCVERHKDDADFYSGEWRIYLSHDYALWKSRREMIELLDQNGKLIASYSY